MSGTEALALMGVISNIMQLADFCARVSDRAIEFAGRTATLPGSFSDLRVVLAVVRLNLKRLLRRLREDEESQSSSSSSSSQQQQQQHYQKQQELDPEAAETLGRLVGIIEREIKFVHERLDRLLPPPGASWAKVTVRAIASVFGEGKIKSSTDCIMRSIELLSITVTASLPTADEIAKAVSEKSTNVGIDRKLSMILDKMKVHRQSNAITRANTNATAFTNRSQDNRVSTKHGIKVKGQTQINNTYITLQIPYEQLGKQLDANGGQLMIPGTAGGKDMPFYPLKPAISNPNLSQAAYGRRNTEPQSILAAPVFDMSSNEVAAAAAGLDLKSLLLESAASGGPDSRPKSSRSHTSKTYPIPFKRVEEVTTAADDDSRSTLDLDDAETVVGSTVFSYVGSHNGAKTEILAPPRSPRHHRAPSAPPAPTVPEENLHTIFHELDGSGGDGRGGGGGGGLPSLTRFTSPADMAATETASSVGTASDTWSETAVDVTGAGKPHMHVRPDGDDTASTAYTGSTALGEDEEAFNKVNAYIRQGALAVTKNSSEAKRNYVMAQQACKDIVTCTPAFNVRKFRALTQVAVGLSLCTTDRERYLGKARGYNALALSAAASAGDRGAELRVLIDEAELQMKEARVLEKSGRDATLKHFAAFGAFQAVASRCTAAATEAARRQHSQSSNGGSSSSSSNGHRNSQSNGTGGGGGGGSANKLLSLLKVGDCNTHAQALLGCGVAAGLLARNGRTFHNTTSSGAPMLSAGAYYEQALAACRAGVEVGVTKAAHAQARGEDDWAKQSAHDLAQIKETEEKVMRLLGNGLTRTR